jgi:anthranilate synthase component I, archaeal clade
MTLETSRERFRELVADVNGAAVIRVAAPLGEGTDDDATTTEKSADVTPLAAYSALSDRSDHGFLLESAQKVASSDPDGAFAPGTDADQHARYSFVGYDPEAVVSVWPDRTDVQRLGAAAELVEVTEEGDVVDRLRRAFPDVETRNFPERSRQTLSGGFVGFLAYDAVYDLWLDEVDVDRPEAVVPDAEFCLTTRTIVFDEMDNSAELVLTPIVTPSDDPDEVYDELAAEVASVTGTLAGASEPEPGEFTRATTDPGSKEAYETAVQQAKQHVLDGDIYQGVVSRSRELTGELDPRGLYAALREVNPSPYMYLLRHGDRSIVGASPETLVSVGDRRVVSNPIAGTCSRGNSPVEDRRLAGEMLADEKERAEHTMLVDLARNDVRRVAEPGSVRVEEFMNVLKYSHVQHIESTVTGSLADEHDAFDATRATFPAGTLTGAPKVRAMEIIDELESEPRGVYGGGVGYYAWTGDADFAIVIRTGTVEHHDSGTEGTAGDHLRIRAGAGIVADSDPTAEYEETEQKMDGVRAALDKLDRQSETTANGVADRPFDASDAPGEGGESRQ